MGGSLRAQSSTLSPVLGDILFNYTDSRITFQLNQVKIQIGLPQEWMREKYMSIYYDTNGFATFSTYTLIANVKTGRRFTNALFGRMLKYPEEYHRYSYRKYAL